MFNHYKNDTIRKLVIAFGCLFNNIKLEQKDQNGNARIFTVPLSYASKEKFVKRLTQPSSISDKTRIEISLPRISFELFGLAYDPTRKFNKTNLTVKDNNATTITKTYSPVPYNFVFNVNVFTRNFEENLQIMEQILPFFSPEFIVSIKMNAAYQSVDVPISIGTTQLTQEYEGDFSTRRFIVSTYQFIAKSYIYGELKTDYYVREVDYKLYDFNGLTFTNTFGITG